MDPGASARGCWATEVRQKTVPANHAGPPPFAATLQEEVDSGNAARRADQRQLAQGPPGAPRRRTRVSATTVLRGTSKEANSWSGPRARAEHAKAGVGGRDDAQKRGHPPSSAVQLSMIILALKELVRSSAQFVQRAPSRLPLSKTCAKFTVLLCFSPSRLVVGRGARSHFGLPPQVYRGAEMLGHPCLHKPDSPARRASRTAAPSLTSLAR